MLTRKRMKEKEKDRGARKRERDQERVYVKERVCFGQRESVCEGIQGGVGKSIPKQPSHMNE